MKKIIIFILLIFTINNSHADTLVIPSKDVDSKEYFSFCAKPGYICTTDYFLNLHHLKKSDRFEQLITKLDLTDAAFVDQLPYWIQSMIMSEPLSEDQAEALKDLCRKSFEITQKSIFKSLDETINQALVAIKLNSNLEIIDYSKYKNSQVYYLVFKKILTEEDYMKVKHKLGSVAVFRFSFNQNLNPVNSKSEYLIEGDCEQHKISTALSNEQLILPIFKNSCSLSDSLTNGLSRTNEFITENKSTLLWVGLAVLAVVVSQKYEIEMSF